MQQSEKIIEMLGGKRVLGSKPSSDQDFIELVRGGLPFVSFQAAIRSLGLSEEETREALQLPKRTLARRKAKDERLRATESERVLRLVRVGARAIDVLGDVQRAVVWLRTPNRGLGGDVPIDRLDTDVGTQGVVDVLTRIEHGVFS